MYHTSPNKIESGTINSFGIAGDCLFFSNDVYATTAASELYVYEADFSTVSCSMLYDECICNDIANRFNVDVDTAERLLDGRESEWDYSDDADDSWWLQGKRGQCAKAMGYDGAQDADEQGVVYIIPMTGREHELALVQS